MTKCRGLSDQVGQRRRGKLSNSPTEYMLPEKWDIPALIVSADTNVRFCLSFRSDSFGVFVLLLMNQIFPKTACSVRTLWLLAVILCKKIQNQQSAKSQRDTIHRQTMPCC